MEKETNRFIGITLLASIIGLVIIGAGYFYWQQEIRGEINESKRMTLPEDNREWGVIIPREPIKEKIVGGYEWEDPELEKQYSNVLWNRIVTHKFAGFSPRIALSEKRTVECKLDYKSHLRVEGGLCGVGYWFEDPQGKRIGSLEDLKDTFLPIDGEAEAVSFVMAITEDLKVDPSGIPEGHTLSVDNSFLVHLVKRNTYGCGNHSPTGVIFEVTKEGNIRKIAFESPIPIDPRIPSLCVD